MNDVGNRFPFDPALAQVLEQFLHCHRRCDVFSRLLVLAETPTTFGPTNEIPHRVVHLFAHEGFNGILIAQPVPAGDGVVTVLIERVVSFHHPGRSAFGRDGVAAHGINLGDDRHAELGIGFRNGNRGAQSGATAAN